MKIIKYTGLVTTLVLGIFFLSGVVQAQTVTSYLAQGSSGPEVVNLQTFLKSKGFLPDNMQVTGQFDILTEKGVKSYQQIKGVTPTGTVGPVTRRAIAEDQGIDGVVLGISTSNSQTAQVSNQIGFTRTLRMGYVGQDVMSLQSFLQSNGYFPQAQQVTTYYGPITENAVKQFQAANGIVSSGDPSSTGYGQVGPTTRAKLIQLNAR